MNHSGDAAEQIVRMSLEGIEVAAKITGAAAKEIAIMLIAALKSDGAEKNGGMKLKGKERLESMLKSGKALEIFSVKNSDLAKFAQGAKQYGIVYCVLRDRKNSPDGLCDILVKADDAPKINRLVERFKFATVDVAKIENEIVTEQSAEQENFDSEPEVSAPETGELDNLLDEFMGAEVVTTVPEAAGAEAFESDPFVCSAETLPPSELISDSRNYSEKSYFSKKPSVKVDLSEIRAAQKEKETPKRDESVINKAKSKSATIHTPPNSGRKRKTKKSKERG
jgi:hypothetical protein